jgi:hypothetical protein
MLENINSWLGNFASTPAGTLSAGRMRAYAVYLLTRQGIRPAAALSNVEQELTRRYPQTWQNDLAAAYLASTYRLMQRNLDARQHRRIINSYNRKFMTKGLYLAANLQFLTIYVLIIFKVELVNNCFIFRTWCAPIPYGTPFSNLDPGGFAEFVRVPAIHVESVAFPIPANLTESEASFMEPLGCAVRAVKRAGVKRSDVVILVGLGSIGLLLLQLLRHTGAECIGVDLDSERRQFAKGFGLTTAFGGSETELQQQLIEMTEGRGADGVLLPAGNPALVSASLTWLREGGTCTIFASLHPDSNVLLA